MANSTTLTFPPSSLVAALGRLHAAGIRPEHFNPFFRLRAAFLAGLLSLESDPPERASRPFRMVDDSRQIGF